MLRSKIFGIVAAAVSINTAAFAYYGNESYEGSWQNMNAPGEEYANDGYYYGNMDNGQGESYGYGDQGFYNYDGNSYGNPNFSNGSVYSNQNERNFPGNSNQAYQNGQGGNFNGSSTYMNYNDRNNSNYSNQASQNGQSGNISNNGSSTYMNYNDSKNAPVSDQDLSKKIQDKIGSGWFSKGYEQVHAQVNNGYVTLDGSVKTADDKEKVEKEVRNIEGVKGLNSQISVQDTNSRDNQKDKESSRDNATNPQDEQLNQKIRDQVTRGWLWNSYKDVTLNTNNGAVTLEGTVNDRSDEQKLKTEIQKVEGVRSVNSNLQINNSR